MCFSAPASFIASGGLSGLGIASLRQARKREWVLAAVPFIFAFQQGMEGIQWIVSAQGLWSSIAGYGFLIVALFVWPLYVPLGVHYLDQRRDRLMHFLTLIGTVTAVYFVWYLGAHSLTISKLSHGVSYGLDPQPWPITLGYMIATIGPLLLSSRVFLRIMGLFLLGAAVVSWFFFSFAFVSVWCFFSAVLSGGIYLHLRR